MLPAKLTLLNVLSQMKNEGLLNLSDTISKHSEMTDTLKLINTDNI